MELGSESWTSFTSGCSSTAVQRTLSLCLCPARQLQQQLRGALVAAQWRGDTALTLPLFWRQSTVSPVFFLQYLQSSLHSLALFPPPPPPPPPSLINNLTSVDVKQHGQSHRVQTTAPLHLQVDQAYFQSPPPPPPFNYFVFKTSLLYRL